MQLRWLNNMIKLSTWISTFSLIKIEKILKSTVVARKSVGFLQLTKLYARPCSYIKPFHYAIPWLGNFLGHPTFALQTNTSEEVACSAIFNQMVHV